MAFELKGKLFIFLDTNILECRHSGSCLFLSKITFKSDIFKLNQFIKQNKLEDKIELCIPEIVKEELCKHLIECYKSQKQSLLETVEKHKKTFGGLIDISYEFSYKDEKEYTQVLDDMITSAISTPPINMSIVPYPMDEETIKDIIHMATWAIPPFRTSQSKNGKQYSDAGLKDALLYKTFLSKIGDANSGILISEDSDFGAAFDKEKTNIQLLTNIDDVIDLLKDIFNIQTTEFVAKQIETNQYLHEKIVQLASLDASLGVKFDKITSCTTLGAPKDNEPVLYTVLCDIIVGDQIFTFEVQYDSSANEIISANIKED